MAALLQIAQHTSFFPLFSFLRPPSLLPTPPLRTKLHLQNLSAFAFAANFSHTNARASPRRTFSTIAKASAGSQHGANLSQLVSAVVIHPVIQTLATAVSKVLVLRQVILGALQSLAIQQPQPHELESLATLREGLCCAAAPLCFAAISRTTAAVNTPLTVVASGMAKWLELYSGVLMVRVLLSWFPNIPWERQPLQAMRDMCDPYLNLFRNIIPPLFNVLDLSPLLAFLVLGLLASILNTSIRG